VYTEGMNKHISTHLTALLSGATSILALIHPGFHLNPVVQGFAFSLPALFAAGIEAIHFLKTHALATDLAAADHVINALIASQSTPAPAPVAASAEATAPTA